MSSDTSTAGSPRPRPPGWSAAVAGSRLRAVAARPGLGALALALTLAMLPAHAASASAPPPAPLAIVPGQGAASTTAGRCLGLLLMSDKSASQARTDPGNLRIRAAAFAIDMLSGLSTAELRHSAGVVSFGSSAPASAAVGLLALPDLTNALPTSLMAAPTLGGTDFPAAFARALQLIRASIGTAVSGDCERRRYVVFVYSDLMPNSGSGRLRGEFREIARAVKRLRALDVRVHVFAFSRDGRIADLLRRWRATGISGVVPVRTLIDGELERSYARVLAGELGLGRGRTARLSARERRSSFVVPDLSDRLIVVPYALARTHLRLRSPAGAERDIRGMAVIDRPVAGQWSVTLADGAATAVGSYAAPAVVRIASPDAVVPLGSKMRPAVSVTTSTGAPVRATRSSMSVEATVSLAGRRPLHVELEDRGGGRFIAKRAIDASSVGPLNVAVSIAVGAREVRRAARDAAVRRVPYLAFTAATPRAGRALTVALQLRLGGSAVDAAQALDGSPDAIAVADLRSSGRDVEHARVAWAGGSRFEARFRHRARADRRYAVSVQMVERAGQPEPSPPITVSTILTPRSALVDRLMRAAVVAAVVVLASLLLLAVAGLARMALGERIDDDVVVPVDGATSTIGGGGRRLAIRGGPWPLRPLTFVFAVRGGTVLAQRARIPRPWGGAPVERAPRPRRLRRPTTSPIRGGSRSAPPAALAAPASPAPTTPRTCSTAGPTRRPSSRCSWTRPARTTTRAWARTTTRSTSARRPGRAWTCTRPTPARCWPGSRAATR